MHEPQWKKANIVVYEQEMGKTPIICKPHVMVRCQSRCPWNYWTHKYFDNAANHDACNKERHSSFEFLIASGFYVFAEFGIHVYTFLNTWRIFYCSFVDWIRL